MKEFISNLEFADTMPTTAAFFTKINQQSLNLKDRDQSGLSALKIAQALISDGFEPEILSVYQEIINPDERTKLVRFTHQIEGNLNNDLVSYLVCATDDYVFDPMLEQPVHRTEYSQTAFGQEIELQGRVSKADTHVEIEKVLS